jgi:hypothetical protein
MSTAKQQEAFLDALRAGTQCRCPRCAGSEMPQDEHCRTWTLSFLHPADAWTIPLLRDLSINGSFK